MSSPPGGSSQPKPRRSERLPSLAELGLPDPTSYSRDSRHYPPPPPPSDLGNSRLYWRQPPGDDPNQEQQQRDRRHLYLDREHEPGPSSATRSRDPFLPPPRSYSPHQSPSQSYPGPFTLPPPPQLVQSQPSPHPPQYPPPATSNHSRDHSQYPQQQHSTSPTNYQERNDPISVDPDFRSQRRHPVVPSHHPPQVHPSDHSPSQQWIPPPQWPPRPSVSSPQSLSPNSPSPIFAEVQVSSNPHQFNNFLSRKPTVLACNFCRQRKIACVPAYEILAGEIPQQPCGQCARRNIECNYSESRRGRRKSKKPQPQPQAPTYPTATTSPTTRPPPPQHWEGEPDVDGEEYDSRSDEDIDGDGDTDGDRERGEREVDGWAVLGEGGRRGTERSGSGGSGSSSGKPSVQRR